MIVIAHQSALACYRIPELASLLASHNSEGLWAQDAAAIDAPGSKRATEVAGALNIPLPLHVLVAHPSQRKRAERVATHLWTAPIAPSSIIHLDGELYVVSPEFMYQQLCCRSSRENQLMVGSELISNFAINPSCKNGIVAMPPRTTIAQLTDYLSEHDGEPGSKAASGTLPHLVARARSPKEVEIALLLTLPRRLGGRAIKEVELDRRIDLSPEAQRIANRKYLLCDLYLPKLRTDLEYDSTDFHLSRVQHEYDKRRENALRIERYQLMNLTSGQLHDWETFDKIARYLEASVGSSQREATPAIVRKQQELWNRLLFAHRQNGKSTQFDAKHPSGNAITSLDAY